MINNPELIEEIKENLNKISKEDLEKVMKKVDEWYDKELEKSIYTLNKKKEIFKYGKKK